MFSSASVASTGLAEAGCAALVACSLSSFSLAFCSCFNRLFNSL